MTHDEAVERLPSLIGLRPADAEDAALRAHVRECATCQARLETLQRIDGALRSGPAPVAPSEHLTERVLAVPRVHPQQARRPRRRRGLAGGVAGGIAAALAALALVAWSPWEQGAGEPTPGFSSVRAAAIEEPSQGIRARLEFGRVVGAMQPVRLTVSGLGPQGRYELWLAGGGGEVAVGSFRPGKDGACSVLMDVPAGDWSTARIVAAGSDDPSTEVASGPV